MLMTTTHNPFVILVYKLKLYHKLQYIRTPLTRARNEIKWLFLFTVPMINDAWETVEQFFRHIVTLVVEVIGIILYDSFLKHILKEIQISSQRYLFTCISLPPRNYDWLDFRQ